MKLKKHYKCAMAIAMSIAMLAGNLWLTGDMPYVEAAEPEELVCEHHVHDEECGYNEETKEGCTYECPECAKEDDNIIEEQEEQKKEEEQVKEEEQKSSEVEVAPMAVDADESTGTENTKESDVAVTVTVSGATTSYSSLQEAVAASEAMDGTTRRTIKLMADADITTTGLNFMKSTTLDLNGYEIKAANTDAGNIKIGNSFTLNDSSENKTGRIYSVTTEKTDVSLIETGIDKVKEIILNDGRIDTASAGAGNDTILITLKTTLKVWGNSEVKASGNAIVTRQDAATGTLKIQVSEKGVVASETGYGIYYAGTKSDGSVSLGGNAVVYGKSAGIAMENGSLTVSGFTGVVTSKGQDSNGKWGYGSGDAASPAIYLNGQLGKVKATISSNGTFIGGNEAIKVKADNNAVTVAISNGQYSSPVKPEWCADGYVQGTQDEETKLYGVEIIKRVVNTNTGKFYNNTSTAVSEAQNGETIQLLDNCTYSGVITIDKSITLDLNSFTLTSTSQSQQSGEYPAVMIGKYNTIVDVVIKNGTIKNTNASANPASAVYVQKDADVKLENTELIAEDSANGYGLRMFCASSEAKQGQTVTVGKGSKVTGSIAGIAILGDSKGIVVPKLIVEDGNIAGGWYGIAGNGMNDNTAIEIKGGTISSASVGGAALYHPQNGDLTITGGKLQGETGVQYMGTGAIKISGGEIVATAAAMEPVIPAGDGLVADGAALSIYSRGENYGGESTATAEITGGTFTSKNNIAIREYGAAGKGSLLRKVSLSGDSLKVTGGQGKEAVELQKLTGDDTKVISGGIYSSVVPADYCAEGYVPTEDLGDGTYGVKVESPEASVNGRGYLTLQDALKAAQEGDTVQLLKDKEVNAGEELIIGKAVNVEIPAGITLTNNGTITVKGTLKINENGKVINNNSAVIHVYGTVENSDDITGGGQVVYHTRKLTFADSNIKLTLGETTQVKAEKTPDNAVEDIEYSVDSADVISIDQDGNVTAIGAGKAIITAKSGDIETTCTIEVTKKAGPSKPDAVTGKNETVLGKADGKITGVTSDMEYRLKGTNKWIGCSGTEIENLKSGTYEIRYKETADTLAGEITEVTINADKIPEKPEQKPDDSKINKNDGSDKPNTGKSSAQSKSSEKKTVKTVKKADTVKTADTANIYLWGLIAIGALLVAAEVILIKRRLRYRNR